ncbi:MAG: flagellar biosynthetic protein FliO [Alphaproteobacteria bacterium]
MTGWHDLPQIVRMLAALAFVVALMGGLSLIMKKVGMPGVPNTPQNKRRLKLIESLTLDARRRAVILQCDDKQHLVILGPNGETVVKNDMEPIADDQKI